MLYRGIKFPKIQSRPFFYTNFVATVDGKVQVLKNTKGYWPIGSRVDHDTLIELRVYADVLVHGANLAKDFGDISRESLGKENFKTLRKSLGKNPNLPYFVVTKNPKQFPGQNTITDLNTLVQKFNKKGYQNVLVEGGPTLLGSLLKMNLMDEIFLTIAPKIFGSEKNQTLTLVEGVLFPADRIKRLKLISVIRVEDELFLRYNVTHESNSSPMV